MAQVDLTGTTTPKAPAIDATGSYVEFHNVAAFPSTNPSNDPSSAPYVDPTGTPNSAGRAVSVTVGGQAATIKFSNPS